MSEPFLGEIRMFGGNFAPRGWALCQGQLLSISQYSALFALIGTNYGGDGRATFALPNLQGCLPIGQGQGPGLTNRVIGQLGGHETVTLTNPEMPIHSHTLNASTKSADSTTISNTLLPGTLPQPDNFYVANDGTTPPPTMLTLAAPSCGVNGSGQSHSNLMPALCITYILALQGVFPSRN